MQPNITSKWNKHNRILITCLQGVISVEDVRRWKAGLSKELGQIEPDTSFKLMLNMLGYEPQCLYAHKLMREVIPQTQAIYGFRTQYFDLFDEDATIQTLSGIQLKAVAHLHHDNYKMTAYQKKLGTHKEGWFSDFQQAWNWLNID